MVPIFEWQKEELERRKINLLKHPVAPEFAVQDFAV
jgi:hypothetical protein